MRKLITLQLIIISVFLILTSGCDSSATFEVQTVSGPDIPGENDLWLSHEHILVDFIGADSINPDRWDREEVFRTMKPYLEELKPFKIKYFVDATPNYLARDVRLLVSISEATGMKIITNTGLYSAVNHKYLPGYVEDSSAFALSKMWIDEYENGIAGTEIKPGFIKISVNPTDTLDSLDSKVVEAAALTHLKTGLTIASHTGPANALWPQLRILSNNGVKSNAFIWVHAQNEEDYNNYKKAAELGCWISLDGMGWEYENHIKKLIFAKNEGILDHILVSHDAGWFDPAKTQQKVQPYTNLFEFVIPKLKANGFSDADINKLLSVNPARAFGIRVRNMPK